MLIHYNEISPYCQKLLYFLAETAIDIPLMRVEFPKLQFSALGFSHLSPTGQIPTLVTELGVLADSTVCMRFLAERFGKWDFYPKELFARAEVDLWTEYVNQHIGPHILTLAWQKHWTAVLKKDVNSSSVEQSQAALKKYLPALETHLMGRHYFVGASLTIADINLMGFMLQSLRAELDLTAWPLLSRWYQLMSKRPKYVEYCAKYSLPI
jgi:glutathione S-transferase